MEQMVKRVFSLFLVCAMLMTMLPLGVFAEQAGQNDVVIVETDDTQTGENDTTENEGTVPDEGGDGEDTGGNGDGTDDPNGDEPPTDNPEVDEDDPTVEPEYVYADASNAQELEQALTDGADMIRITSSFALDRSFYITKNTRIYTEDAYTLTRDPAFGGDVFVVGENAEGVLCEESVVLTLGDPESSVENLLTIDGNKENMTVDVVGSVIFVCNNAQADLYPNLTVTNCYKVGNDRALKSAYKLSYPAQIGAPVAILASGSTMNIYGGNYTNNSVPDTVLVGESNEPTMGGAFYNYGTLNVYGGLFQGNHAGRAGAFYNYRRLNIYKADIKENTASTLGGAIYMPNSDSAFTTIGAENEVVTPQVNFVDNTAASSGGAIYARNSLTVENALFEGNTSNGGDGGGAIMAYTTAMTLKNVTFRENAAAKFGGALYLSGTKGEEGVLDLTATNVTFEDNTAYSAGALFLEKGVKAGMEDVKFLSNEATTNVGGAMYVASATLKINTAEFTGNSSSANGGAVYITTDSDVMMNDITASNNVAGNVGGAIYTTGATLEINGAEFTGNSSTGNGGAMYITTDSVVVMNNVTGTGNTAGKNGGFGYAKECSLTIFNNTFRENEAGSASGVWYLDGGADTKIYATTFESNHAATNAGAITMYTGENVEVLLHSCTFTGNSNDGSGSNGFGGALHVSGKTQLKMYNITATDNEGGKGGFMYETSAGTVVTIVGLTVSGNTAREGGPVIWGNTLNAKLFVDKAKYTDLDHTGEYDDAYWSAAVYNLLNRQWTKDKIGSYVNYYGQTVVPDISVATVEVATAEQLEKALLNQADAIQIIADIVVDRSFFVTNDVTIYTTEAHTLTRDPAFGGDIFVVGENAEGVLCDAPVVLTLGDPDSAAENLLTIDGNKENMTVDVVGSAIFVCSNAQADLYPNLTVTNCYKVGNERVLRYSNKVSYANQIGAAVAVLVSGTTMNIYGGNYTNNSVPDTVLVEEKEQPTMGGAFYNYGTLNVYGGLFQGNHAGRAGAFYNYRRLNIYKADIKENTSSTAGGAIYMPNSDSAFTTIGAENEVVTPQVNFVDNTAAQTGGAIYARNSLTVENALFEGNASNSGDGGGAIMAYTTAMTLNNVTFRENTAAKFGGALYLSGTKGEEGVLDLTVTNVTFEDNTAYSGGALFLEEGVKAGMEDVKFLSNEAVTNAGGAIYATSATLEFNGAEFTGNSSSGSGGAVYITTDSDVVMNDLTASDNVAGNAGGAIYTTGTTLEINGAEFTDNSSTGNGGAMYITTDSVVVMNNVTGTGNTAGSNGGFAYAKECSLTIYNSQLRENTATANGGVFYLAAGAATALYGTTFVGNHTDAHGGVMSVYSAADVEVLIHSCTFQGNSAASYGGVIHTSGSSQIKLYCIKAIGNSAGNGGFLYETTTGTNVTLAGITLTGNTATVGGPIIWGNSTGAKLYIDKAKYMDMDHTGDFDSDYWAAAIYNKLKVYNQTVDLPTYVDYDGQTVQPQLPEVTPYVTTSAQLERALKAGCEEILITADFLLDRTFYITRNTKIYSTEAHTLTRDPAFGGDIFVVGENAEGVLCDAPVVLTLGDPDSAAENLLTIDGNKDNMTADVVGSVIFVCNKSQADLYPNLTVTNCYKVGNERALKSAYKLSYPAQIGAPVAILAFGSTMNIYGGNYTNNSVPDTVLVGEKSEPTMGGAFYNYGTLNVYGGLFQGNHAGRAGAFYNYRRLNIYKADIKENTSSTAGGAIYMPNSDSAFTTIGAENEVVTPQVNFVDNTAASVGGAIYARNSLTVENALFEGNTSNGGDGGGAIMAYTTAMTLKNVTFRENAAAKFGGALYLSGTKGEEGLDLKATNVTFEDNTAYSGGALFLEEGVKADMEDVNFQSNEAVTNAGGAMYITTDSVVVMNNVTGTGNTAGSNGGFAYAKECCLAIYNSQFQENTATANGGVFYLAAGAATALYGSTFVGNHADAHGGVMSVYSAADVEVLIHSCVFQGNSAASYGGVIHTSGSSQIKLYSINAIGNSAGNGGFLYETTTGTNVTLAGITLAGNTATVGGPIIWGNSTGAKLFIDKEKYTDLDHTGEYDADYWAAAIYNKLTVKEVSEEIPKYLDYGNEAYDHMIEAVDVSNAQQMEDALNAGAKYIRVVADFQLDRTFYITKDIIIFSTITRTLTRAPGFGGDIFVVGQYADGTNALLKNGKVKLTLGNPQSTQSDLLIIDGNRDQMSVDVVGSVIFLCNSSELDLHQNITIRNCFKAGNERSLDEKYGLSAANRLGGSVILNASGAVRIYGGLYENNGVREEVVIENAVDDSGKNSTVGGVIYNRGTTYIYGGRFENNQGARGGVIYNTYITEITGGSFVNNRATTSGGVVYQANNSSCHLRIGKPEGVAEKILFEGNSARSTGGAIYTPTLAVAVVYGDAVFTGNSATNGGAIASYGQLIAYNSEFRGNVASNRGGAVYMSKSVATYTSREHLLDNCVFEANQGYRGGAVSTYASGTDYEEGVDLTVRNSTFTNNLASKPNAETPSGEGGAIYTTRTATLRVEDTSFSGNSAATEGGDFYASMNANVTITGSTFQNSSSGKYGGSMSLRSSNVTIQESEITGATAVNNGGAIYISYNSESLQNTKLTITDSQISQTATEAYGGVIYATRHAIEKEHRILTVLNTSISNSSAGKAGGAFYLQNGVEAVMNKVTADTCVAATSGGFLYTAGGNLKMYGSELRNCSAGVNGGALAFYEGTTAGIYTTTFEGNTAVSNGGAAMVYTDGGEVTFHSCTLADNTAENVGGGMYVSKKSQLNLYNTTATGNTARIGGFLYVTTTGTVVTLNGATISGNTAAEGGPIIWGNSTGAKLKLNKSNFVDSDAQGALDADYWAAAIVNLLTVEEISDNIPACEEYKESGSTTPKPKKPVPVDDVLNLGLNSSDGYIDKTYDALPKLDNSRNFMSQNVTTFENINGGTVTVDSFVYPNRGKADNGIVGLGLLIYQAILYKQANPEEEVYIDTSYYRFSVQAGVNINRNSRYFGYARNLPAGKEYDEFGFVRISYLLVTAAKMGIHVTAMGQRDGYPIVGADPDMITYFNKHLTDPCDPNYVENAVVGDYMKFTFCEWTVGQSKGGSDMMHLKICAVSHYLDMNGVPHRNAVYTSSSNLDGIRADAANGNWKLQTSTIVSDHEAIYRTSVNYIRLVHDYSGQGQIYEFQDLVNERSAQQIDMILAGNADQIPADQQLVYLGGENDPVFELYFTPFGGNTLAWDAEYNPYCKYLEKLYNSEDYILFTWNTAEYNGKYALGRQMEQMITAAFHENKNVNNRIYANMESFDYSVFNDLEVGKDIGAKSFNKWDFDEIHNKDMQVSYVENGQRYYVSLLNSLNIHGGSMYYQSNFMLVVKETELTEDSVFFTLADLTTKNIVEHAYGEKQSYVPDDGGHGYYYQECAECGKIVKQGTLHRPSQWITDVEPTETTKGIQHQDCTVCGCLLIGREISSTESISYDFGQLAGRTFTADPTTMVQVPSIATPKTIEALIQLPESVSDRGGVVVGNYGVYGDDAVSLEIHNNGNVRLLLRKNWKTADHIFDVDVRSDSVTHIAITVDGTKVSLYINGLLADTAVVDIPMPENLSGYQVGGDNREGNTQYFKGTIHAVNIFGDVRTPSEIKQDAILVRESEPDLLYSNYFAKKQVSRNAYQDVKPADKVFSAEDLQKIDKTFNETPKTIEVTLRTGVGEEVTGVILGNYSEEAENYLNLELCEGGRLRLVTEKINCIFDTDIRSEEYVHIALTVERTTARLYVNGQLVQTKTLRATLGKAYKDFVVGGDNREGNTAHFQGSIQKVSLFRDVRTQEEILTDMILVAPNTYGLLYTGAFATDISKETDRGATFTSSRKKTLEPLSAAVKTIEVVIQLPNTSGERGGVVLGNYGTEGVDGLNLEIFYGGYVRVFTYVQGLKEECIFEVDVRSAHKKHLALTLDGTQVTLYVDGQLVGTQQLTRAVPEMMENICIGGDNRIKNAQYFKGSIYSVGLYSELRTQAQIQEDFEAMTGGEADLYAQQFSSADDPANVKLQTVKGWQFARDDSYSVEDLPATVQTIEAVVQLTTNSNDRGGVIVGSYKDGNTDAINLEVYYAGRIRLYYMNNGTKVDHVFTKGVSTNGVTHVAVTVSDLTATLYINGNAVETAQLPVGLPQVTKGFTIGGDNRWKNTQYFKGTIYSVNLYADVRTPEEVRKDALGVAIDSDNLMFNKTFTQSVAESKGMTFQQTSDFGVETLAKTPATIEAIIQLPKTVTGRGGVIVGNYDGGTGPQMNLEIFYNGRVRLHMNDGVLRGNYLFESDIRSSQPRHIAVTVSGSTARLYIDGECKETLWIQMTPSGCTDGFMIGSDHRTGNSEYFKGSIYSVSLFEDVRTPAEIYRDSKGVAADEEGLLFTRSFTGNECVGSVDGEHTPGQWTVVREATESEHGLRHRECSICGKLLETQKTGTIQADGAVVDYTQEPKTFSQDDPLMELDDLTATPLTFEFMLHLSKSYKDRAGVIFGNYTGGAENQINVEIYNNGQPRLYFKTRNTAYTCLFKTDIRSDSMIHMALVVDGTAAMLYVNSELVETKTLARAIPDTVKGYCIGGDNRWENAQYFKGSLYAVNLFEDVRTPEEIYRDMIYVAEDAEGLLYSHYFVQPDTDQ